jgi:hypothetical protein
MHRRCHGQCGQAGYLSRLVIGTGSTQVRRLSPSRQSWPTQDIARNGLYVDPDQWSRGIDVALVVAALPAFLISDFGMLFYGCLWATFVQSAFTGSIGGCLMAGATQNRRGV